MNPVQLRHLAGTLRAVALAQLVIFGYSSFAAGNWLVFGASTIFIVSSELLSLFILRGASNEQN